MNLNDLASIAIKAATTAGREIRLAAKQNIEVDYKEGGHSYASQVVTAIDRKCDGMIRQTLAPTRQTHGIGILSEEYPDDGSRFEKDCFWCVDPLDGTLAFINKTPGYAVSIALVSKAGKPLIGVVYNPTTQDLYHAIYGEGVFKNGKSWQASGEKQKVLTYVANQSLANNPKAKIIQPILEQKMKAHERTALKEICGGGAVWNAIRVLEEAPGCMIKPPKPQKGGGSLWDYAATACIFNELGYQATDFYGAPLDLNKKGDSFMNQLGVFYMTE